MAIYKTMEPEEFVKVVGDLKKAGKSEKEIMEELDISSKKELREYYSHAVNVMHLNLLKRYRNLKEAGYSRNEIAELLGINESTVRAMEKQEELNAAK